WRLDQSDADTWQRRIRRGMCLTPIGGSGILAAVNDEVPGTRSKLVIGTDEESRRTCGKHLWRASLALSENRGFQGMEMTKIPLVWLSYIIRSNALFPDV
ncbi:hypothetical protein Tco_0605768, partial [Tanacetum coccineum]